ncbi:VTT domain-containing protein [Halosegnis sp.]|uniref:VTT domain-containing protein n=1 Tax=Halosegnis sp. TaxID=2864959 RepID=UPI0035D47894
MDRVTRRQAVGVGTLVAVAGTAALIGSPSDIARQLVTLADRPLRFGLLLGTGYLLRFLVAWPISILSVTVGVALGPAGVPIALGGAVVTCLPPYLLAGRVRDGPLGTLGEQGRRYFTATGDLRGTVAARLAPLPADPVSYTAGLAGVRPGAYALGTALGELPWVTAAVLVGAGAGRLTVGETSPIVFIGAAALALLVLAGPLYRLLRTRGLLPEPLRR